MIWIMFERLLNDVAGAKIATFRAGDSIFKQGARASTIFQVRAGKVALERHLADGAIVTIATAGPEETFAEAALFSDRYHCEAVARVDCEVLKAPAGAIRARLESDPQLACAAAVFFARQVRDLRTRLELQRVKRAPDRLLAWLRWRASGNPPTIAVADPWSRIAGEVGLTPEALYRALRTLESAGFIERRGRETVVLCPAAGV